MEPAMSFDYKPKANGHGMREGRSREIEVVSKPVQVTGTTRAASIGDYWFTVMRHQWTVLSVMSVVMILGAILSLSRTKEYEAVGRIVINREGDDASGLGNSSNPVADDDYMVAMDTQMRILESDAIAKAAIRQLNLDSSSTFAGKAAAPAGTSLSPSAAEDRSIEPHLEAALVAKFHKSLRVSSIPRTRLLEIGFSSVDPALSAKAVNTLIRIYIEQNYKTHLEATSRTADWLSQQLTDLEAKVEESQEKLVRYQKEHDILGLDDKQNLTTSKLDELNKEVTAAEADRIQKESIYHIAISSGSADLLASSDPASPLAKLRSQEEDLHRQLAQASVRFQPTYPAVEELTKQLESVQADIKAEVARLATRYQKEYLAAVEHEQLLRASLERQKSEANQLNENAIQYNLLKRDVDSNRLLYDGLQQKLKEAGVMSGLKSSNVRIVDAPSVPVTPVSPGFLHDIAMSFLLGLAGGVVFAFILESRNNAVQSLEQAEAITGLPVLAMIPLKTSTKRSTGASFADTQRIVIATQSDPTSEIAEAYRALRTSILLSRNGTAPKVLVITSALPQDGKTTTSVNLSIVFAQQGARVLLIEGDMRRASISAILNFRSGPGLSTILDREADLEEAIRTVPGVANLAILPAGPAVQYPSEMLAGNSMRHLIAKAREHFDYVVIDSPPVLSVTDAVLLSALSDATILVARAGVTSKIALRRLYDVLARVDAKMLGLVLNATASGRPDRYYYGGYRSRSSQQNTPDLFAAPQSVEWSKS
jgi:polysaccharide biosynthesis transport protein